ncbi:MAG: hypothetical protein EOP49_01260 [Sphingobacteriales bacterium]|nr:MAG: hypothetical protein EOP49_01260 [Sphingobacteriales bacterium]
MNDQELLIAHNVYSNKGAFALFLGSGISRSAGIPTGWEIILKLIARFAILKTGATPSDPEKWYRDQFEITPNYSHLIESLTNTQEERVHLLKPFFEPTEEDFENNLRQPTAAHRAIARLVQKGYIRVIVTTNFDRLMENALRELSIEATIISNPTHVDNVMPLIHSPFTLLKINGDYLDTKFLNLESELSEYDDRIVDQLKFIFENFGLITAGWSAKWDIALRRILEASVKFRFSNYFTYVTHCEPELGELAGKRGGKLVQVQNADIFFRELAENVEALEKGEKQNPFTREVVLQRLKKYIVKEEFIIVLYELIKDQQDAAFKLIFEQPLPNPSNESVKEIIQHRLKSLNLLSEVLAQGIYWGKEGHREFWLQVLLQFANPPERRSSYAIWSSLAYMPALALFYVIGVGALLRRDYALLAQLFSLQISNPYRDGDKVSILANVNTASVIEKDQLNGVLGENKIVPVSELIWELIKPLYTEFCVTRSACEEVFDEFELLISLKHIEIINEGWFPPGRYYYRRRNQQNIIYARFKELQEDKELHEWVTGNLFKDLTTLQSCYARFNEKLQRLPWH